ncbi:MAG: ribosome biogenesis GTPase Der [Caldisericia bacterium]
MTINAGKIEIADNVTGGHLPVVALIGRPSVGKSTLFNRILGRTMVITDKSFGVTRDRILEDFTWNQVTFTLMDTGGIAPEEGPIQEQVSIQSELALGMADIILFVVDSKIGPTQEDIDVAKLLRKKKSKVILVGNKTDNVDFTEFNFYTLGFGEPYFVSATTGRNLADLLDDIVERIKKDHPESTEDELAERVPRIAIAGRPNVGKSSLLNKLIGEKRATVSNVAGTTRDAVDTDIFFDGKRYKIVDTAGIIRKYKYDTQLEHVTFKRSQQAIHRSDVVILVVDGSEGIVFADKQIAKFIHDEGKACLVVVNKIDLVKDKLELYDSIDYHFRFMSWAPRITTSALTGKKVQDVFKKVVEVAEKYELRITTGRLNKWLVNAVARTSPTPHKGRLLKIYYATQTGIRPPRFDFFINDTAALNPAYERYLLNSFRDEFDATGTR